MKPLHTSKNIIFVLRNNNVFFKYGDIFSVFSCVIQIISLVGFNHIKCTVHLLSNLKFYWYYLFFFSIIKVRPKKHTNTSWPQVAGKVKFPNMVRYHFEKQFFMGYIKKIFQNLIKSDWDILFILAFYKRTIVEIFYLFQALNIYFACTNAWYVEC